MSIARIAEFVVERHLGRGGMAEVWAGVQPSTSVPVAIKVMDEHFASSAEARHFVREVRAMAGLDHPGCVRIFDCGEIPESVGIASLGRLPAGSPWLAMELAEFGDLAALPRPRGWPELRRILLDILAALGHAHARGVVHRDLKPENVLATRDFEGARLMLSDFGIVHLADRRGDVSTAVRGTPAYMSPEQVRSRWRDYGPWTDLYSLGCMAMELASGRPPFDSSKALAVAMAHLTEPAPVRVPSFEVPDGFTAWVARLLQKDPRDRFRSAADAAYALRLMDPTRPTADLLGLYTGGGLDLVAEISLVPRLLSGPVAPIDAAAPPVAPDWRVGDLPRALLPNVGLGLFGLRSIPFVGREKERDILWRTLNVVCHERRPRMVLVEGDAGIGKSRLVSWLAHTAHELAGAQVLRATHAAVSGPRDGLGPMLRRHFKCKGLTGVELRQRVGEVIGEDADAISAIMLQGEDTQRSGEVSFSGPRERYSTLSRWLQTLAAERPIILWLEDVQWGYDALSFARYLLGQKVPVMIVATLRQAAIEGRPMERDALAMLSEVRHLRLAPLSIPEQARLVRELLGLGEQVGDTVLALTVGHPLFAVQLVADWVEQGALEVGPDGYILSDPESQDFPLDLDALFERRVERVLEGYEAPARLALQAAAALGQGVDEGEWRGVCNRLDAEASPELLEALFERGMAQPGLTGWSFTYSAIGEALLRAAGEGRARIHGACAEVIAASPGRGANPVERRARHLLEAGRYEEALDPILRAAEDRLGIGDFDRAEGAASDAERLLDHLRAPRSDGRRGRAWVVRAKVAMGRGDREEARRWLAVIDPTLWPELAPDVDALSGLLSADFDKAVALLGRAAEGFADLDPKREAECRVELAMVYIAHGALDAGEGMLVSARGALRDLGDSAGAAKAQLGLAGVARVRGDLEAAVQHIEAARLRFEEAGVRHRVASCALDLGDVRRDRGDLERAAQSYGEAIERFASLDSADVHVARARLALVMIAQGRAEHARALLQDCRHRFDRAGLLTLVGMTEAALAECAALSGNWAACQVHLSAAEHALAGTSTFDKDAAGCAQRVAELALAAGAHELEHQARRLSEWQQSAWARRPDP